MLTDEQSGRNRLPPMLTSPPPPKRHKSESTPASEAGRSARYSYAGSVPSSDRYHSSSIPASDRYQSSSIPPSERYQSSSIPPVIDRHYNGSVPPNERARSRQTSTAMDIYTITDRNPSDKDGDRRTGRFLSNGSVASQASQVSRASGSSPPIIISNSKYVLSARNRLSHFRRALLSRILKLVKLTVPFCAGFLRSTLRIKKIIACIIPTAKAPTCCPAMTRNKTASISFINSSQSLVYQAA